MAGALEEGMMKAREAGKMNALGTQIQEPAHLVTEWETVAFSPGHDRNSPRGWPVVELADLTGTRVNWRFAVPQRAQGTCFLVPNYSFPLPLPPRLLLFRSQLWTAGAESATGEGMPGYAMRGCLGSGKAEMEPT